MEYMFMHSNFRPFNHRSRQAVYDFLGETLKLICILLIKMNSMHGLFRNRFLKCWLKFQIFIELLTSGTLNNGDTHTCILKYHLDPHPIICLTPGVRCWAVWSDTLGGDFHVIKTRIEKGFQLFNYSLYSILTSM